MTDAPGRIWAASGAYPTFDVDDWENASASAFTEFGTEYIRADLARPMTVAEAAKVLEPDLDQLMSLIVAMPVGRQRREALAKVTEIRALSQGDPTTPTLT